MPIYFPQPAKGDAIPGSSIYESDAGEREILSLHEESLARLDARHERLSIPTSLGETRVLAVGPEDAPPLLLPDEGFLGRQPIRRPTLSSRRRVGRTGAKGCG